MQKLLKTLGHSIVCLSVIMFTGACFGDTVPARGAATQNRGRGATAMSRMPSIPVLPVSATGNMTTGGDIINPQPTPTPTPTPTPGPTPTPEPDTPVTPPAPECPDGGVVNSEYTVEACMNDILSCVNGGSLPNGINSLFNEDLRNSIVNGMGLCLSPVERCITTVRRNCQNVYESAADVWLDFNARKVQPAYYAFVLRQTGLTPTQAENTCLLLDRNTYGASFDAVSVSDRTTSEYAKTVGAYNSQMNNSLTKANPLGVKVNNTGIDGQRGYYARWDAENAQCLLRVAAYNKDTQITNSWLFGTVGDDSMAEVWQNAGSTFTCNKDLFGFSLMPKTKTTAAVAIPGGTLLGAGIGALAGHGAEDFNCQDEDMRNQLLKQLQQNGKIGALNAFLDTPLSSADRTITAGQCLEIVGIYDLWQEGKSALDQCRTDAHFECFSILATDWSGSLDCGNMQEDVCNAWKQEIQSALREGREILNMPQGATNAQLQTIQGQYTAERARVLGQLKPNTNCQSANLTSTEQKCSFKNLNKADKYGLDVYCNKHDGCLSPDEFDQQLSELGKIFNSINLLAGRESNRLKTTLIGAGTGAALGGTATAITAFVERNNINCRVADGLAQVQLGKSYTIDRLRDFYVKWALNLPQTLAPTAVVSNCDNWQLTCAMFTDLEECASVQFNYRPGNLSSTTLVQNPCRASGSACIANLPVAQSYGVCLNNPSSPDIEYPVVQDCREWQRACNNITNQRDCSNAKVIYAPKSMQVANACAYNSGTGICGYNLNKLKLYVDVNTCPVGPAVSGTASANNGAADM